LREVNNVDSTQPFASAGNASSGMNIHLVYDASALAAPQSFRDGMQAAADILDSTFHDPITVNIAVGYGEFEGHPLGQESLGGTSNTIPEDYPELRSLLMANATSTDQKTAVADLPDTTSLDGQSLFFVSSAQGKALGIVAANDPTIDGTVGMSTSLSGTILVSAALHELTHAMGRVDGNGFSLDLFRYSAPGVHVFSANIPAPPAYFSIDGGRTPLADFGRSQDPGDFLNPPDSQLTPNDPFNEITSDLGTLTAVDITEMDVLGFHSAGTSPPPRDTTAPTVSRVQVLNVSVRGRSAISKHVLKSVDPDNSAGALTYTVTTGPANGELLRKSQPVTSFTQAQINHGRIFYQENAATASADQFSFRVADPAGNSATGKLRIAIGSSASDPLAGVPNLLTTPSLFAI
jgi:hypothetical protein